MQAMRLDMEQALARRKIERANQKLVKSYVEDVREVLSDNPLPEQKAFIRSFVKEVKVTGSEVLLTYTMPMSPRDR